MFVLGPDEKCHAEHHQPCANTEDCCLSTPSRECRGFRYTDIDDKRIVAQRTYSNQPTFAVDIIRQAIGSTTLGNKPMPR